VLGWSLEVTRRLVRSEAPVLPVWSNFGGNFSLGIKATIVTFVGSIPLLVIYLPLGALSFFGDQQELATAFTIASICTGCLALLYSIVIMFALPASLGQLAATDSLAEAFKVGRLLSLIRAAPAAHLIVILGLLVSGIVAPLGSIACGVGVLFTLAYSFAANGHLYGQAHVEAVRAAGA
ncbi:MAG: DUF4013 domain-containing protein, partial [Terriglobales bacterium]